MRKGAFGQRVLIGLVSVLLPVLSTGCRMSTSLSVPAASSAAAPVIEFSAAPETIEPGEPVELRWTVRGATEVLVEPGAGSLPAQPGSRRLFPMRTTTYKLIAKGPAGSASASVVVNVVVPAAPALPRTLVERMATEVRDIYFDLDMREPREDSRAALGQDANALTEILRDFPGIEIVVEGHCDDSGPAEYNLELGYRRAEVVRRLLENLGVPGSWLKAVSRGEAGPPCMETTEACRAKNRRVHFVARLGRG
jgi:outer membrane protein OmpA-like peptidoglycan-associated protein